MVALNDLLLSMMKLVTPRANGHDIAPQMTVCVILFRLLGGVVSFFSLAGVSLNSLYDLYLIQTEWGA
jgi:hypothetical protein